MMFRDGSAAPEAMARIGKKISRGLAAALPSLLSELPDRDAAVLLFDRLLHEAPAEIVAQIAAYEPLAHYALTVFGYSRFLGETLLQHPQLLGELQLDQSYSAETFREHWSRFRTLSSEPELATLLARFKRREYVRIMLRDLLGIAPLAETTAEISALADVLIAVALAESERRLGEKFGTGWAAPSFAILSLGKLGGNELNYSSDADLLYVYGESSDAVSGVPFSHEYMIRLAQQVTEILSMATREGAVFRIDMRLRPQGTQGELAVSLTHALDYYGRLAQDWERQALIKARYVAGDAELARTFIAGVQALIYTQATNLEAIGTALEAREKMSRGKRRWFASALSDTIDVKRDPGGIRDIEFLVQCLQRVYGGAETWLRSGGTLFSLQKLHDKGHIDGKDFQELSSTYVFLRHVEHRLQLRQGQQTHRLPSSPEELAILQRSLASVVDEPDPAALVGLIQRRMEAVAKIYHRVMQQQGRRRDAQNAGRYELQSASAWMTAEQSNQEILRRLAADSPRLYAIAASGELSGTERKNLFRFFSAALTSSERYAAVLREAEAVPRALRLFESSEYLTQILIRHPEEIATLGEMAEPAAEPSLYLFESGLGAKRSDRDPVFAYVAGAGLDAAEKLAWLRRHYRHRVFSSGARDIIEMRAVYDSLATTTAAAEDAIQAAFEMAGAPAELAVLALGRLGSREFDLLSDADLLFVCEEQGDRVGLTKAAERLMQALAAYTRDGMVFPVDTRLRPRGREGELLVTPSQLASYGAREAQPWEALTYTKLRSVAGSSSVGMRAVAATHGLFERFAGDPVFGDAVRQMREKLETLESQSSLKTSAGAVYDIDFLCSFLLVKNRVGEKPGTLRDRLWRCAAAGLLSKPDAGLLDHAAELFRTVDHVLRLVSGRARRGFPANEQSWQITQKLTSGILRRQFGEGLEAELQKTYQNVRGVFLRVLPQPVSGAWT